MNDRNTEGLHDGFLDKLFDKYFRLMCFTAYERCRDRDLAEDIAAESFIKLIPKAELLKNLEENARRRYVVVVTFHTALTYVTKKKHYRLDDLPPELISTPAGQMEDTVEKKMETDSIFSKLPAMYGNLLFLKYYMGYSYKEIAELTGLKLSSIPKSLARARQKAKEILREEENG